MSNQLGDRRVCPKTDAIMVYVPSGKFMMGSDNAYSDEESVHEQVIANGFWLDLTPVTNAAYAKFVADGGYQQRDLWTPAGWTWREVGGVSEPRDWDDFTAPDQPRVGISWYEAWAFAAWRGGRLPTEAEWEWAARGPENRVYAWGNSLVDDVDDLGYVIYAGNSGGKTHPVGEGIRIKGAAWCGALDMCGNVWEWVSSVYEPYPYRADDGRETQDGMRGWRALRGGSWGGGLDDARAAYRNGISRDYRDSYCGFRVAYDV